MATNKDFIVKNGLSVGEDISVSGSVTSNLQFDDSVQAQFGTDSDLLIYHADNNSYIVVSTYDLAQLTFKMPQAQKLAYRQTLVQVKLYTSITIQYLQL